MSSFSEVIRDTFPGTLSIDQFVTRGQVSLASHGFSASNTIACLAVCRDELCRPLGVLVEEAWGEAFNFASLAGLPTLGKTGFGAAHHHAPVENGRERYLYIAMPHIGIGGDGSIGACERRGRPGRSSACGALSALQAELAGGALRLAIDPNDVEQSILKAKLVEHLAFGTIPDLLELTRVAERAILAELETMIGLTVDGEPVDYAVLTGIQIHGPGFSDYVRPGESYVFIEGERRAISF